MTSYRVTKTTECLTQPVSGNKSGQWADTGDTFESVTVMNGWVKISDKRWIPIANCVTVSTPPPDPDPEPATGEIMRQSFSHDGGLTYPADEDLYWLLKK